MDGLQERITGLEMENQELKSQVLKTQGAKHDEESRIGLH